MASPQTTPMAIMATICVGSAEMPTMPPGETMRGDPSIESTMSGMNQGMSRREPMSNSSATYSRIAGMMMNCRAAGTRADPLSMKHPTQ